MTLNTRFFIFIQQINFVFFRKLQFFQKKFSISFFCLFLGFLIGNLFGTFLNGLRGFIFWDGFIISLVLLFCEFISYCLYSSDHFLFIFGLFFKVESNAKQSINDSFIINLNFFKNEKISICKILNYFKLGLLFGFFIDAYKVGS